MMIFGLQTIEVIMVGAGLALGGLVLLLLYGTYKKYSSSDEAEIVDTEGLEGKNEKNFKEPSKTQGAKVGELARIRSLGSTDRVIGHVVTGKESKITVLKPPEELDDSSKDENKDVYGYEEESVEGVTYGIIEGSPGVLDLGLKKLQYSLMPSSVADNMVEYYDVPKSLLVEDDECIRFDPECHFVNYNGVKRHLSPRGMSRQWEASAFKLHTDYLNTLESHPEIYGSLNTRLVGQIAMENIKSENIKEYINNKFQNEKDAGMEK